MRKSMWTVLALAIVIGLAAGYLALNYVQPRTSPTVAGSQATIPVVVAQRDLPAGAILRPSDVKMVEWPAAGAPRGHASSASQVVGQGLILPVSADEPLLASKLAARGAGGGLPIVIPEGMRAVTVKVDDVIGVAGFVLPGTRVDVVVTFNPGRDQEQATSRIILQNVEAVAAGQTTQRDEKGTPKSVPVITLLVTPEQAETLTLAATEGQIQLALRNMLDMAEVETPGVTGRALVGRSQPAQPAAAPVRRKAAAPRPSSQSVVTYNGSQRSVESF